MSTGSFAWSRLAAGVALAVLSGVLAALAAPPFPCWPLILVAFVPMIVAQHRILPARWSPLAPGIALGLWFASQLLPGLAEAGVAIVYQLLPLYAGLCIALAQTHYTHLVFRASENRVSVIKADKMRDAAAIDPWGRVVAQVVDRRGQRSTLIADLPLGTHDSLFVRWGDWTGWICALGLAAFVIFSHVVSRRVQLAKPDRDGIHSRRFWL